MVLPVAPNTIYLSQVNTELGKAYNTFISLNQADVRQLFQVPTDRSTIYMSTGYGRGVAASGRLWEKGTAGDHNFVVPWYNTMFVDVRGAGGGGEEALYSGQTGGILGGAPGITGGASLFNAVTQVYGFGGGGANNPRPRQRTPGAQGGAQGGSTNTPGGGAPGGAHGFSPTGDGIQGDGGPGGRATITYTRGAAGAPVPYTNIYVAVGAAGAGGGTSAYRGSPGGVGYVGISWS